MTTAKDFVDEAIHSFHVVVFSKTDSLESEQVKELLDKIGATHHDIEIDQLENYEEVRRFLAQWMGKFDPTPSIFSRARLIGGFQQVNEYVQSGRSGEFLDN